ncbi:MAG: hypothetical protein JRJ49_10695 [Deltaproteobacteria bacterium]|nr:hypothetical protein [Deltaproteobacteria bacterium]
MIWSVARRKNFLTGGILIVFRGLKKNFNAANGQITLLSAKILNRGKNYANLYQP